jgi:ribonuclease HII
MGYCVPEHVAALGRLGATIHHRRSFAPVALVLGEAVVKSGETAESVLPL